MLTVGTKNVTWCPPVVGWVKINTDGAASKEGDWSATGRVF